MSDNDDNEPDLNESGTTWVDGMVVAQLRLQHKVDPDSGEDLLVT